MDSYGLVRRAVFDELLDKVPRIPGRSLENALHRRCEECGVEVQAGEEPKRDFCKTGHWGPWNYYTTCSGCSCYGSQHFSCCVMLGAARIPQVAAMLRTTNG